MLPSLTVSFIAGLLVGSQIPYFPLSASFFLFLSALGAFILERLNRFSADRRLGSMEYSWWESSIGV
jgi:hypothetical protein